MKQVMKPMKRLAATKIGIEVMQQSKQALAASRIAATVTATKPVKIGGSFVLDFSNPRHAKRE